jgi:hypothetical protein
MFSGQWAVGSLQFAVCSSQRSTVHGPQQRDVQWAVGSGQFAVCSSQRSTVHGPQQRDVQLVVCLASWF